MRASSYRPREGLGDAVPTYITSYINHCSVICITVSILDHTLSSSQANILLFTSVWTIFPALFYLALAPRFPSREGHFKLADPILGLGMAKVFYFTLADGLVFLGGAAFGTTKKHYHLLETEKIDGCFPKALLLLMEPCCYKIFTVPKYWCKHCKIFVRDTKLEKTNHEATPKHQGNIKRFLRDLHRGHEREERDKQRAKSEVERLNGVVSGTSTAGKLGVPWTKQTAIPSAPSTAKATPAERKAQMARLAEMGVAVPEDFRREMAMAGDWQTLAERPVWEPVKTEEGLEDFEDFKPDLTLNIGVRKRKHEGEGEEGEEEDAAGSAARRKGWGSVGRRYPGSAVDNKDDLDALLSHVAIPKQNGQEMETQGSSTTPKAENSDNQDGLQAEEGPLGAPTLKKEHSPNVGLGDISTKSFDGDSAVKQEDDGPQPAITFKKRKGKSFAKT
ncbi:MAG: hypothetical protein Q9212_005694 [Teloschistes hypoglaucus]